MMAVILWIITTGITLMVLYLIIRAAVNHSVLAELYGETRQLYEQQSRNEKAIAKLTDELVKIRQFMEQRGDQAK
ncbi:hypothetical protein E5161_01905 [Cohnella pontilimi]|uniref:Uncharacterized protein n=1 Tax=Cohnella pontilimi TaxID=2564100 RepID=A0A4U0FKT2_9BACL|nr:hypothetical protein [Cohnella pontilimi]TJY44172.1 hypothetical protein E5161_01905 [Cohnella pontilimi]